MSGYFNFMPQKLCIVCVKLFFFILGKFLFFPCFNLISIHYPGLKKSASGLGQTDFLPGQIILKFAGAMGKGLSKSSSN